MTSNPSPIEIWIFGKYEHPYWYHLPDKYLYSEPGIADTLNEEESIMSVGAVLVQGPGGQVPPRPDGDVPDHRDPHVRVGLQAEGQDGDADKEDSCSTTGATYPTSQSSLVKVKVPCMCVWGICVMRQV